jgi:hypothetical protein
MGQEDKSQSKRKPYVRKYRTLQIKGMDPADNDNEKTLSVATIGEIDLK